MARTNNLSNFLTDVANAIRNKKGTNETIQAENFDIEIASIPTGGGQAVQIPEKDINFYDYDGTVIASYSLNELPLAELPTAPEHTGLTFQEWTHDLDEINATDKMLDVGATYITDNGETRIYVEFDEGDERLDITVSLYSQHNATVTIDWGDGTVEEKQLDRSLTNYVHTYSTINKYVVKINSTAFFFIKMGGQNYSKYKVRKVEFGNYAMLPESAFADCINLKCAIFPNTSRTINDISSYGFARCYSLEFFCIPKSVTTVSTYSFSNCTNFKKVVMPLSISGIYNYAFQAVQSLEKVILPKNANIDHNAVFYNCVRLKTVLLPTNVIALGISLLYGCSSIEKIEVPPKFSRIETGFLVNCTALKSIYFPNRTSVPTLKSTNAFPSNDFKIYVPNNLLQSWKTASNWSSFADKIYPIDE